MTIEEAKAEQARIAQHYRLEWYYGTDCTPCCEVFPKFEANHSAGYCWYECPVCGKRTAEHPMPWLARDAWNRGETFREKESEQLTLF